MTNLTRRADLALSSHGTADARAPALPTTAALYATHARTVAGWASRLIGPGADVDDVVHEVFLVVQRRLPEFRSDAKVTTWLYEITFRVVQAWRRRVRWRSWLGIGNSRDALDVPAETAGPLQALESRQATTTVYAVLERLPEKDRTILILFEIEEMPGQDIAVMLGVSLANVWVRLHRARARFLEKYRAFEQGGRA